MGGGGHATFDPLAMKRNSLFILATIAGFWTFESFASRFVRNRDSAKSLAILKQKKLCTSCGLYRLPDRKHE
jgi:hypothetical protein